QEVHLDRDDAVPLAALAASALDVEREAARTESPRARVGQHREQLANEREETRVGRRVRSWRPSDGRLIDLDDLVDLLDAVDRGMRARLVGRAVERPRKRAIQDFVDERGLA